MSKSQPIDLDPPARDDCRALIDLALAEDLCCEQAPTPTDCTSESVVSQNATGSADFKARQAGVICGLVVCEMIADRFDNLDFSARIADGDDIEPGEVVATLTGSARQMLLVERVCLNFLGRLSGIASLTRRFVSAVSGARSRVYDTRKTTPGWRQLEKYAVRCGGGFNHRTGLFDAVLIKDNHLAMLSTSEDAKSTKNESPVVIALQRARNWIDEHHENLPWGRDTVIEVEVDRLEQLEQALAHGADVVLLDNMTPEQIEEAVSLRDGIAPHIQLEASGGVTLATIGKFARTGVDRISVGAITHSAPNLDVGLDWQGRLRR